MNISLIISTYNKPLYLSRCLKSIASLNEFPDEIIVADDGSGEETFKVIEKFRGEASLPVHHVWQEDKGFRLARSRNNAILKSSGDYLIFIDDDLILHPKFITDHRNYAKKGFFYCGTRARLGEQLTTKAMNSLQNDMPWWETDLKSRLNTIRIPFLHKIIRGPGYTYKRLRGCHMAFWREDLIKVNGFDERYSSYGREDSDIAMRMMHAGIRRINLKWAALCYHLYHPTTKMTSTNDDMLFEVIRTKSVQSKIGLDQH